MTYVSAKRAAALTGFSEQYITSLARAGKVVARRLNDPGGVWLIDKRSLLQYAEQAGRDRNGRFGARG